MKTKKGNGMPEAWVVSSKEKGRKKIYRTKKTNQRKVYLKDKEEFQIEIFNPTKKNVLSIIHLDGKPISKTGLIIRNGERIYLDCFIDDQKKFIFETYNVDGSSSEVKEAISSNGNLEVSFYNEEITEKYDIPKVVEHHHHHHYNQRGLNWNPSPYYYGHTIKLDNTSSGTLNLTNVSDTSTVTTSNYTQDITYTSGIETGKVGKGEKSNQQFEEVDMDFSKDVLNEISIKLMPKSRKPKTKKDIVKKLTKNSSLDELFEIDRPKVSKSNIGNFTDKVEALTKLKDLEGFISDEEMLKLKSEILIS